MRGTWLVVLSFWMMMAQGRAFTLEPHRLELSSGKAITLSVPQGWDITVAATGMKRPRFMAFSPDGRLFLGDMYNKGDTRLGHVYVLDDYDPAQGRFGKWTAYLSKQRNPNSVAFFTDPQGGSWIYVALTDDLLRYPYRPGDLAPSGAPQTLASFPAYGLNYKYGGWHLTRTVLLGEDGKLYVSVGSSCDSCPEKKGEIRACILQMDPDGSNERVYASGIRNAVGMKWAEGRLIVTAMGADKLGDDLPLEAVYSIQDGANYGWPFCYNSPDGYRPDPKYAPQDRPAGVCERAPAPYWTYLAHAAPLGLEYFDASYGAPLTGHYLVSFHGSSKKTLGHGYRVVRMLKGEKGEDFITGFRGQGPRGKVFGRPCDILKDGRGGFFLTDDFNGVLYHLQKKGP
ncbi:MAG TPA: PQQ-dependent sugar dehydrogenase [bacterium]|nr:PQQ-dependent sugar dehydrogenase [bacterium]